MSTQKGTANSAVTWSIGVGMSGTGVMDTELPQSLSYALESDKAEIKGSGGDTACIVYYNQKETMTIEVIPSDDTIANVKTSSNVLPAIGADITITDSLDSETAGAPGTTNRWHFDGGSKAYTVDGECRLTMNLTRYASDLPAIS